MKTISKIFICLCVICFAAGQTNAQVSVGISVRIGPPELPVYVQPECPVDGYLWEPGYWAYDDADGYYWVPGVWVAPPDPGYFWTPPYWGYADGLYGFHRGYWGPHVGYYGGIDYGYGYGGYGFTGGRWAGNRFSYNTAVMHVNRTVIHNTYVDRTVVRNEGNRKSFNGPGGVTAKPHGNELAATRDRHIDPTSQQVSHERAAATNRSQFAKVNNGRPAAAAMDRVQGKQFNTQGHAAPAANVGHTGTSRSGQPVSRQQQNQQHAPQQQQRQSQQQQRAPQQQQQRPPQQQQRAPQQQQQRPPQQQQRAPQQQQQRPPQQQQQRPQQQQQRPPQQQQQRPPQQQQQRPPQQQQQRPQQQQQQRPPQQQGGGREHHG
jgi:hypothetical protein